MKSKRAVVSAGVADHPNQLQFTLFGLFIGDMVKKLDRERGEKKGRTEKLLLQRGF